MTPFPAILTVEQLSAKLGQKLLACGWRVATAESCTGGGIAAAITKVAGSSKWFEYGIVSYANQAKQKLLNVSAQTLTKYGPVSEAVVSQMVAGVLALSDADIAVAVSGIAGPDDDGSEQPIGTVWFAWGLAGGEIHTQLFHFPGDRTGVQLQAVEQGLRGLLNFLP
jgi:nicotinamide-nucleotide amidase